MQGESGSSRVNSRSLSSKDKQTNKPQMSLRKTAKTSADDLKEEKPADES